jgi:hypothetical protein
MSTAAFTPWVAELTVCKALTWDDAYLTPSIPRLWPGHIDSKS